MQPTQPANQLPAVPSLPQPIAATQPPVAQPQPAPQPPAAATPELADDGDLIEKEWVQQAKHIVQSTAGDPFQQSAQFTQLKAQYMQKRYGKQLKTDS